jgi:hypothetical protein
MAGSRYVRQRPLTLAQQGYLLKATFPDFRVEVGRCELRCSGELRPTWLSDSYTFELVYHIPDRPKVYVISPSLRLPPGQSRQKHVFKDNALCLYSEGDWRPDLPIASHMVGWISEWLSFYEDWLATEQWLGGGHEPGLGAK